VWYNIRSTLLEIPQNIIHFTSIEGGVIMNIEMQMNDKNMPFAQFSGFYIKLTNNLKKAKAITHSGCFHADEIFSTVILLLLMKNLVLARIPKISGHINPSAIIYDIGGGVFDHHQPGGNGARENGIRYSSFGLMWKAYGRRVLEEYYKCSSSEAEILFNLIDEDLVQSIDCIDNGQIPLINNFPTKIKSLSSSLADFYPSWNEVTPRLENEKFLEALQMAFFIFNNTVVKSINKLKAKAFVEKAIEQSVDGIMVLNQFVPWRTWTSESTNAKAKKIKFVIFPSNRGGYNIATVPKNNSLVFPEKWAGLSGKNLQKVSKIETATFCHPQRHIGGALLLLDAVQMARSVISSYYARCS